MVSDHWTTLVEHDVTMRTSCFDTDFASEIKSTKPVADLRGEPEGRKPCPLGLNYLNFMQVLGKFSSKIVCSRPRRVGAPTSDKSWIRHCKHPLIHCFLDYQIKKLTIMISGGRCVILSSWAEPGNPGSHLHGDSHSAFTKNCERHVDGALCQKSN